MPSQSPPPNGLRPRIASRPAPRPPLRLARAAAPGAPAVNPDEDTGPPPGALIYWPVIGAAAGLCVVLLMLLVIVLRSEQHPHAATAAAQEAHEESGGARAADTAPAPAPREASSSAPDTPPPPPKVIPPAAGAPADADPTDDGSPAPPPLPTGLPDLLVPRSGECQAPAPGEAPGCGYYGTTVSFVDDPADAARRALKEKKLLFVLHVAGNFEDSHFT